jgi:uncharacterized membrane protein (UPF0136 family)
MLSRVKTETWDRVGMAASAACGVHCLLAPLAVGAATVIPLEWLFSRMSEGLVLALALLVGLTSLVPGYFRRHRRKSCLALFALGGLTLAAAKLAMHGAALEPWLLASGAALITTAHGVNLRLCRSCQRCNDAH